MAVTMPFVFLAQDYLARRPWSRAQIMEKLPFIAVAAAAAALAVVAQKGAMPTPGVIALWTSGLVAARGAVFYVCKTVLPIHLSAFYPYPEKIGILEPQFLVPLCVLVLLGVAALLAADRSRRPTFAFLFFLLTLVPVLKIVPIGNAAAADRYTYIPSAGVVFLAAGLAGALVRRLWERRDIAIAAVFLALLGAVSAALGLAAHERCKVWRDSVTLWRDVIAKQPKVALARYNLGLALRKRGDLAGALEQYREAIKLDPGHANARNNIAFILRLEGDADKSKGKMMEADRKYAEAEALCREALRLEPEMWEASLNLSFILGTLGRYEEALASAHRALQLNSGSPDAWYTQGVSLFHLNRFDEAIPSLDRAVELDPDLADAAEKVKARMLQR
jgi:tetratricopeptide (TPR) repeat protein